MWSGYRTLNLWTFIWLYWISTKNTDYLHSKQLFDWCWGQALSLIDLIWNFVASFWLYVCTKNISRNKAIQSWKVLVARIYRSSGSEMLFKIGVLKNFVTLKGKHLCWSLFLINFQTSRFEQFFFTKHLWLLLVVQLKLIKGVLKVCYCQNLYC